MAIIQLFSDYPTHTAVPNAFIEHHMLSANGEFVKIYLYLLRSIQCKDTNLSISSIADFFAHTEKDIERALKYWEKEGVLSLTYGNNDAITGIRIISLENGTSVAPSNKDNTPTETKTKEEPVKKKTAPKAAAPSPASTEASVRPSYSLEQMSQFMRDPLISEMMFAVETYIRKPISSSDQETIFYWIDELKFSPDLVEYLVEYCITNGHTSFRYMDKVAQGWKSEGISSLEDAKAHSALHSKVYYAVMKAFGITGRSLVTSENEYIEKWTKQFAFDTEIIVEACNRTITSTRQASFPYADTILTKWHQQKVHTLADIQKLDASFRPQKITVQTTDDSAPKKNAFTNFEQRSYDMDDIERMLLTTQAP